MRKLVIAVLAVAAALGVVITGCAPQEAPKTAAKPKIVFATDATWPPMEFLNEKKEIVGFDIDLVKEIAAAAGFDYEIRNTAWDGIFAGLANDQYDAVVSSVTITEERKKTMDFSDPYFKVGQAVVVPVTDTKTAKLEDLAGKAVGAQIGTTGAIEVAKFKDITLRTYDEIGLAFEDLINGRIAAAVCDTPTAAQFALQNEQYKGKLRVAVEIPTDEYYGFAVKKGNTKVLELLNDGIRKVRTAGKIDELKKKWMP